MLQQEYMSPRHVQYLHAPKAESLNVLAYKSVAVDAPTDADIQALLRSAQARNKAEGLSGVLLYDRGTYFQWLEGPTEALARVWDSISRDPRHCQVKVLRDEPISDRVFDGWDLRIVLGSSGSVNAAITAMDSSTALLKRVVGRPKSIIDLSLEDVFSSIVIPRLNEVHGRDSLVRVAPLSTAGIWHAEPESGARMASALVALRSADARHYVDSLLSQGASFDALYHEVFEPAQLHLGRLWDADKCNEFELTVGLARLQLEFRRVNARMPAPHSVKPNHRVLLCSQPHEPHSIAASMSSEMFNRQGWDVDCELPGDDDALNELVRANWFDVLKVSLSGSLRRDSRLASMRTTIDAARSASLNPSLIVMVDGRTFIERPQVYLAVHANAMSVSALDAVSIAEKLLAASRSLTSLCQVSMA